jgi:hypothetical protein
VVLADDAPTNSQVLQAVGIGEGPLATVSPMVVNFGNQPEGTTTALGVTLTSAGTQLLTITNSLNPSGPDAGQFSVAINGPAETCVVVAPGGICSLSVSFKPSTTGPLTSEIEFVDNSGAGSPQVVTLIGTGTGVAPITALFRLLFRLEHSLSESPAGHKR